MKNQLKGKKKGELLYWLIGNGAIVEVDGIIYIRHFPSHANKNIERGGLSFFRSTTLGHTSSASPSAYTHEYDWRRDLSTSDDSSSTDADADADADSDSDSGLL